MTAIPAAGTNIPLDTQSMFVIILVAALAAVTVALVPKRKAPAVVVVELFLGIIVGPQVLDIARPDGFMQFLSNLGLAMLFFFAGYEIDFQRIKGMPLRLGVTGWLLSLALAYGIGGALAAAGIVLSLVYTGSAMATTAIGTLIPVLRDNRDLHTPFGGYLMAAGSMGEFGPVLLITIVLTTKSPLSEVLVLVAFILVAVVLAIVKMSGRNQPEAKPTVDRIAERIHALLTAHEVTQGTSARRLNHTRVSIQIGNAMKTPISTANKKTPSALKNTW